MRAPHLLWLLLPLIAGLAGCPGSTAPTPNPSVPTPSSPASNGNTNVAAPSESCAHLMQSVQEIFDLQTLDLESDVNDGLNDLNRWLADCAESPPFEHPLPASIAALFSGDDWRELTGNRFTAADGEHLRTCLVLLAQSQHAAGNAESGRDQISQVFEYVIRTIDLVPDDQALPLTTYEVCLTGRGTAKDRAWIFAGLLRQIKIDAVLLRAADTGGSPAELVAVLLKENGQDRVYLFDPLRGVAVRSEPAASAPLASLAEIRQDPKLVEPLAGPDGQPVWTLERLESARIALIGGPAVWSLRMSQLQAHYSGEHAMVVSDPLADTPQGPGYLARVLAGLGGMAKPETLTIWDHADAVQKLRAALSEAQKAELDKSLDSRMAPFVFKGDGTTIEFDPVTKWVVFEPAQRLQWRARLQQLAGDYQKAVVDFTRVRVACKQLQSLSHIQKRIEPHIRAVHAQAVEDAWLFVAQSQFQQAQASEPKERQQKVLEAQSNFGKVQTLFPEGSRAASAKRHLALCQAELGNFADAVATLKQLPADDPQAAWSNVRIREWESKANAATP